MKNSISAGLVGFLFALGLGISRMTQPQKVVGFLDVFGVWDPSLAFVMIGSILVHLVSYRFILKRPSPLFSRNWHLPTSKRITPSLIVGSILFGVGWGLGGFCPGPAITSLASLNSRVLLFVTSMLVGMFAFKLLDAKFKFKR